MTLTKTQIVQSGQNQAGFPKNRFTEEDIKEIANILGIQTTPGFFNRIERVAEKYFSTKNFWEHRENTSKLRADLQKVSKRASILIESLEKLSPLGELALQNCEINLKQLNSDIRKLQKYSQNEAKHLNFVKPGPAKNVPLILFIIDLAMIYREKTGKDIGVSTNAYTLDREGPFLRFIMACLRTVEPNMCETDQAEQKVGELIKKQLKYIKSVIESFQKVGYFSP